MIYFDEEPTPRYSMHSAKASAARKAAKDANREVRVAGQNKLAVFTVRMSATLFGWELRRHRGVCQHRSEEGFSSVDTARQAGEAALAALPPDMPT